MAGTKEAVEAMSAEVEPRLEAATPPSLAVVGVSRGFLGLGVRRRVVVGGIAEVRGPAACLRRDALFRRLLVVADVVAIVGAFVLTVSLARRSLELTWAAAAGVPILVVCAKLTGLYDRDETLLRKTTLDEAPKLFQLATLCALVAWVRAARKTGQFPGYPCGVWARSCAANPLVSF